MSNDATPVEPQNYSLQEIKKLHENATHELNQGLLLIAGVQNRLTAVIVALQGDLVVGVKPDLRPEIILLTAALAGQVADAAPLDKLARMVQRIEQAADVWDNQIAIAGYDKCPGCGNYHAPNEHGSNARSFPA